MSQAKAKKNKRTYKDRAKAFEPLIKALEKEKDDLLRQRTLANLSTRGIAHGENYGIFTDNTFLKAMALASLQLGKYVQEDKEAKQIRKEEKIGVLDFDTHRLVPTQELKTLARKHAELVNDYQGGPNNVIHWVDDYIRVQ